MYVKGKSTEIEERFLYRVMLVRGRRVAVTVTSMKDPIFQSRMRFTATFLAYREKYKMWCPYRFSMTFMDKYIEDLGAFATYAKFKNKVLKAMEHRPL